MIALVAQGAIAALGRGEDAFAVEREGTRVDRDDELANAGLRRPFCARAALAGDAARPALGGDVATGDATLLREAALAGGTDRATLPRDAGDVAIGGATLLRDAALADGTDRATLLLEAALADCMHMLDATVPGWQDRRVGLALGTSSGGMRAFEAGAPGIAGTYGGPVAAAVTRAFAPAALVLAACASSAIAIGLAKVWLEGNRCDLVLAGGFDAVSVFVAAGFECLRATCGERGPRPFRVDRDGLALGEGAAVLAFVRSSPNARAWITGFSTTCDAHHLTAPDPTGAGLARAARAAMGDAEIGLISAHGTATVQNDASEAKTIAALDAPAFSFKGTIGHTLGAAGALETLATVRALELGIVPATHGEGAAEPGVDLRDHPAPAAARTALKLASAFGGANAALVVSLDRADGGANRAEATPANRDVFLTPAVTIEDADLEPARLAARSGYAIDRIARADDLVRRALAATSALAERHGSLQGAGIVVGLGLATIETNAKFLARLPRGEPRRFPYTTPNAAAGECAVAFGLTGPAFAVGGGPHGGIEALAVAADLVRAGIADWIVVVACDEAAEASARIAPGTKSGAVALLVQSARTSARLDACSVAYAPKRLTDLPPMHAHAALLPLVGGEPRELIANVPWGGPATASITWI